MASISSLEAAEPSQPLQPLAQLGTDLASLGLDPALEPTSFRSTSTPSFFARFDLTGVTPFRAQDVSLALETSEKLRNLTANPIGIGNQWSIMWHWLFPSGGLNSNPTFVELSAPGREPNKTRSA